MATRVLRLGTRKSALAQAQANWVAAGLRTLNPDLPVELVFMTTTGDAQSEGKKAPEAKSGGLKALFTKEIEEALLYKRIDVAVHSLKDMAAELPKGLTLAAIPKREDPRDVWISRDGITTFTDIPSDASVGTGAVRRAAQLKHQRPDIKVVPIRGNVDTRLQKVAEGKYDGIILALAGLKRLGREKEATTILSTDVMLPAVGQGALAIEIRDGDAEVSKVVSGLDDAESHQAILAERSFLKTLGGSCQTPIAGYSQILGHQLVLTGLVAGMEGKPFLQAAAEGPIKDAEAIGRRLAQLLLARGADSILNSAPPKP